MIRIRTKLMVFFIVLVLLLNAVAFLLYHNGQKSIDQYNFILQRLYLLNAISQKTDAVYQSLHIYMSEQTPENHREHLERRQELKQEQRKLSELIEKHDNRVAVENYQNMISSFLEESGIVLDAFQKQKITVYPVHMAEAEKIMRFIKETTLELTNGELERYEDFYYMINQKSTYSEWMGISIFVSAFLLCTLFALWFSRGITRPIKRLSTAAKEISAGRFDGEPVKVSTKDELLLLTHTFNDMRSNIRTLVKEMEEKSELDKLLREMELKSLQSQINPHFLFNVLNTITKTAYLEDADRTSDLIESTAALLRYNLANLNKPTTLSREVEVIEHYFFLQTARFEERVRFHSDIDESYLSLPIPHMTLQPIVENSFIHGIESYEEGAEITLSITGADGKVTIEVIDNGVGMNEAIRKRLLSTEEEDLDVAGHKGHSTGLGVKNVMRRLELFYQATDLFDIESEVGKGTKVTMELPIQQTREEEEHDQNIDR
jgi:sensor histidine kinase YesM